MNGLHLGDYKIAVIVSLFLTLISRQDTLKNAGKSVCKRRQEVQNFWRCMPLDHLYYQLAPSVISLKSVVLRVKSAIQWILNFFTSQKCFEKFENDIYPRHYY